MTSTGRPQILFPLFAQIDALSGIGAKTAQLLGQMGVERPRDLILTLPHGVVDRRPVATIKEVMAPAIVTVEVEVIAHHPARKRGAPSRVLVADAEVEFSLVFFHARGDWLEKQLPVGARRVISGKIESFDNTAQMVHPDHILQPAEAADLPRFEPVYPLTAGLSQRVIAKAAKAALTRAEPLAEWADGALIAREGWPDWRAALEKAHQPEGQADLAPTAPARARLAYDEFFAHQLTLALARAQSRRARGLATAGDGRLSAPVRPT